ncbi:hypothetical protein VKT23_007992 [Stygiomarasmius scandens]|uniref:HET-domain-containing protein n=1 Tax=Marasmiellus scandens TaxID=2682957 RepID=A0ABR1JIZ3_9AGAR
MRLLHTSTLKLHEFVKNIPQYAILSHTWEEDEVVFQDLQTLSSIPYPFHLIFAMRKKGFQKIKNACKHALKYGFTWIWIDSCCINKESSSELSEAINSMYTYYQGAQVCYAYLGDVCSLSGSGNEIESPWSVPSGFKECKWFTRGWTLQELLAPSNVIFFDKSWTQIGTKWDLHNVITAITGIPTRVLLDGDIRNISIAKRMSWAAHRQTTREEDRAYSLMGIFGVNMPPIYGEGGERAFLRLQHEIIKQSNDRSIFAWIASPLDSPERSSNRGLFARSPYEFRASSEVTVSDSDVVIGRLSSYALTNDGLRIHLPLTHDYDAEQYPSGDSKVADSHLFLAFLNCKSEKTGEHLAVHLHMQPGSEHQFVRCQADRLALTASYSGDLQDIFVKQTDSSASGSSLKMNDSGIWKKPPSVTFKIRQLHADSASSYKLKLTKCLGIPVKQRKRKNELVARCAGWGKGSDKVVALKYSVTSTGKTLSGSRDQPQEEAFVLLVGMNDGMVFCDILTGSCCDESFHEKLHHPEFQRSNRIFRPLERGGGVVSAVIQPGADTAWQSGKGKLAYSNSFREDVVVLELRIIPSEIFFQQQSGLGNLIHSKPKELLRQPDCGFMFEHPPSVVCLEEVYPEDFHFRYHVQGSFFLSSHTPAFVPGSFFLSIDSSTKSDIGAHARHDFRVLQCRLFPPHGPGFYVVLGIDDKGAWTDILGMEELAAVAKQEQTSESVWRSYLSTDSPGDVSEPLSSCGGHEKSGMMFRDSAEVVVGSSRWNYGTISRRWIVRVRIGKRTGLQLGSHWARIELEPAGREDDG